MSECRGNRGQKPGGEDFYCEKEGDYAIIFVVNMEIMKARRLFLSKACGSVALFLLGVTTSVQASTLVLHRVPQTSAEASVTASKSEMGPQATFALINFNVSDNQNRARALYVSSGNDLARAGDMIDQKAASSFEFITEDNSPTAIIDLGRVRSVSHLSATYPARAGSMDFYVMRSLPGTIDENAVGTLNVDTDALAQTKPAGSTVDDGTQGRAALDISATSGRFVMLRWNPASKSDGAFSLAEVSAFDQGGGNLIASNVKFSSAPSTAETQTTSRTATQRREAVDSKDVPDSKDVYESKDIPAEGPPPPPPLPLTPTFTFIPQLVPVSN